MAPATSRSRIAAPRRWRQDASRLAGREWAYEKVPQKLFDTFDGDTVEGLRRFLDASGAGSR